MTTYLTALAVGVGTGTASALSFVLDYQFAPVQVIAISFSLAAFPVLSAAGSRRCRGVPSPCCTQHGDRRRPDRPRRRRSRRPRSAARLDPVSAGGGSTARPWTSRRASSWCSRSRFQSTASPTRCRVRCTRHTTRPGRSPDRSPAWRSSSPPRKCRARPRPVGDRDRLCHGRVGEDRGAPRRTPSPAPSGPGDRATRRRRPQGRGSVGIRTMKLPSRPG